jgi:uncharacterized protein (TIGR02996 family)
VSESDLLAAIGRDPSQLEPYLVYADWLTERGDPRGELIALQAELERGADDRLLETERALLPRVLGDCAPLLDRTLSIEWRWGFIRRARFSGPYDSTAFGAMRRHEYLAALLANPCASLIEEISIGDWWVERDRVFDADVTALERAPKTLRSLSIEPRGERDVAGRVFGLEGLSKAHPQLVELALAGESVALPSRLHLPKLERLAISEHRPTDSTLTAILSSRWPSLRAVWIESARPYSRSLAIPAQVRMVQFPKLESVALRGAIHATPMVLDIVAASPLLPQLSRLELVRCRIDDTGAQVIAAYRDAFAHLSLLNLEENELTPRGVEALRVLACPVAV